jgi:hypothetical protein
MRLLVVAVVATIAAASAVPAFALPPNPVRGETVSAVARIFPNDPTTPSDHGQQVSFVARDLPACVPGVPTDGCILNP